MTEVNDTITAPERAPKGEKIARGRHRQPAEVAASSDPVQVAESSFNPRDCKTFSELVEFYREKGTKLPVMKAMAVRPDLYRAAIEKNIHKSTPRRK